MSKDIEIKGAKVNNLKSLNISIPKNRLVVVTGVSGSGKTSLVLDTLYAEGQRRYVESLSSYARQFMGRMKKPEVEYIKGLCPAIALEQKTTTGNARSTVGSMTEIYDFLRLLYARIGVTISPISGNEVKRDTVADILDFLEKQEEGSKVYIYAPLHLNYPDRTLQMDLDIYEKKGYSRVLVDDVVQDIGDFRKSEDKRLSMQLGRFDQNDFLILIDRLKAKNTRDNLGRVQDSVQTAYAESGGVCIVQVEDRRFLFNNKFELDGLVFLEPNPSLFNYNNPYGACAECEGFGRVMGIDENKVVPDPTLSVYEGAIACWNGQKLSQWTDRVIAHADKSFFPIHKPYKELTREERQLIWNGNQYFGGIRDFFKELEGGKHKIQNRILLARYRGRSLCPSCNGNRLRKEAEYVKVEGKAITELINIPLSDLAVFFNNLHLSDYQTKIARNILREINTRLENLIDLGLPYLHLDRLASTLSGGEAQRINLTKCIGSNLTSSMYILDEPSIGLHPRDTSRLIQVLEKLRDLGNSVIVVEHEEDVIRAADHIVDIGPHAGRLGGELVFNGPPSQLNSAKSLTGEYLQNVRQISLPEKRRKSKYGIHVLSPYLNNLKGEDVIFKLKAINVVSGVSGSGKTTLVRDILLPNVENIIRDIGRTNTGCKEIKIDKRLFDNIEYVGQQSIGRSSRSNPITYVKAYDAIRKLYTNQNLAKIRGYTPKYFSFNVDGGRCETCKGDGEIQIEMQFLADVKLTCEDCKAQRFKKEILEVRYRDKNIYELLEMNLDESMVFFEGKKEILEKLQPLLDVGLGYLKLGQPTSTLSGGEAQRLKLASYLASKNSGDRYVFIFDEPTTGLHFHDISKLLDAFNALVDAGHTLIIIEHNLEIIKSADWLIDLGPEGGRHGGRILGMGSPENICALEQSYTAKYLKEKLNYVGH